MSLFLGVAWIEFPYFGIKHVVKKERAALGAIFEWCFQVEPAPLFCFFAVYKLPADGLSVLEDSGLDGFVFGRGWHVVAILPFLLASGTPRRQPNGRTQFFRRWQFAFEFLRQGWL